MCEIGVKEIEVGFPSAYETEYEILRTLIEEHHIPDDVTIQVLVQARPHLIEKTFEAIRGAKNVIFHFYNSTSTLQRKVVFHTRHGGRHRDRRGGRASDPCALAGGRSTERGMNLRYEYSPESFSGHRAGLRRADLRQGDGGAGRHPGEQGRSSTCPPRSKACTAQRLCRSDRIFLHAIFPSRDSAIISLHPHNDRGTAVAAAELALLAGAERIEGTLFGNGERTGNVDMVTLAMNMYTQGVDPKLDFSHINRDQGRLRADPPK